MNGVPAQNHLGKTVREVLGELGDSLEKKCDQVLDSRESLDFELSAKLPSRSATAHWIAHYVPISDTRGTVTRVGAVVLEIAAPKFFEQSLQKLDGMLRDETNRLKMLIDLTGLLSSNWDMAEVFPRISARLRRVLCQEFARFALHDAGTGLLVHQATDFPLSKGLMSSVQVSSSETPAGQSGLVGDCGPSLEFRGHSELPERGGGADYRVRGNERSWGDLTGRRVPAGAGFEHG